jgi:Ras-related protein Rab-7A
MAMSQGQTKETLYKVLVVGNAQVGKTALIKRLAYGIYSNHYKSTIGADFAPFTHKTTKLQLWDISGQERFGTMFRVYCKQTAAIVICYDPSNKESFEAIDTWVANTKAHCPDAPIMLLSLQHGEPSKEEKEKSQKVLADKAEQIGAFLYFEVNVPENIKVQEAFVTLAEKLSEQLRIVSDQKAERIIRIHSAIHAAQTTKFKKDKLSAALNTEEDDDDETSQLDKIEKHADAPHRTTTKAKELDEKYPDWDDLTAGKYEEHRKALIQEGCQLAQSKSGLFKKPARDLSSLSLEEIEDIPTKKPESRTALFVSRLKK